MIGENRSLIVWLIVHWVLLASPLAIGLHIPARPHRPRSSVTPRQPYLSQQPRRYESSTLQRQSVIELSSISNLSELVISAIRDAVETESFSRDQSTISVQKESVCRPAPIGRRNKWGLFLLCYCAIYARDEGTMFG